VAKKSGVDNFESELATLGLSDFFKKALDRDDMTVEVLSTGLPRLDKILHSTLLGLAKGRHLEIYSKDPETGKTSLALQIGANWQKQGQRVVIIDIEDTITTNYLIELGYDVDPSDGKYAPYIAKGFNPETGETLSAEEITNNIGVISNVADLVIIDSIAALAKRADLEKDPGDATMGGIGKIMYEHCRKYNHVKATRIWINQALPQIGVFSPAGIKYKTSGGNAIPFFDSIKLELKLVEKLKKGKDDDPYGVVIDVYTAKNKVSPPYKHVKLSYIDGEGFSSIYDLYQAALEAKVIEKSGSWFSFKDERLGQGELNTYQVVKVSDTLKTAIQDELDKLCQPPA
jgi:recombination protein RecA